MGLIYRYPHRLLSRPDEEGSSTRQSRRSSTYVVQTSQVQLSDLRSYSLRLVVHPRRDDLHSQRQRLQTFIRPTPLHCLDCGWVIGYGGIVRSGSLASPDRRSTHSFFLLFLGEEA